MGTERLCWGRTEQGGLKIWRAGAPGTKRTYAVHVSLATQRHASLTALAPHPTPTIQWHANPLHSHLQWHANPAALAPLPSQPPHPRTTSPFLNLSPPALWHNALCSRDLPPSQPFGTMRCAAQDRREKEQQKRGKGQTVSTNEWKSEAQMVSGTIVHPVLPALPLSWYGGSNPYFSTDWSCHRSPPRLLSLVLCLSAEIIISVLSLSLL